MRRERRHSSPFDTDSERILEMIVRQSDPHEVLGALCRLSYGAASNPQIAFITPLRDSWTVAAKGSLNEHPAAALASLEPETLSCLLLSTGTAEQDGAAFESGWGRHFYSGIGEMLGFVVCFAEGPFEPWGSFGADIDAACRLAALALEQKNLRDELTWQSDHDSVTGLYTQGYFGRTLAYSMQQDAVALLHINLDRFRLVNDVLGHAIGNRILRLVGSRFRDCLRDDELLARGGGDEFVVMLRGGVVANATEAAERLLRCLSEPLSVDEHQVFIRASIGISTTGTSHTPQSLQAEAYVALYHAKQAGKARCVVFDPSMASTPPERLEMEKCLRSALGRGEMLLYYQPQLDLRTGLVNGVEALLRWNPEGLGIISPGSFIPILEETGLIVEFGRWVLREACLQGKQWLDSNGVRVRLGVNVSALQLRDPHFVQDVRSALADSGYPASLLELELTESTFVGGYQSARSTLLELEALGVSLALDDFGTGQSSLSYLQELPFHRLKLDQSFVRAIGVNDRCPPVLKNILGLARSMGMKTIAEGIEREHQAEVLWSEGCDEGQGFIFSYPLPPDEFLKFWLLREAACGGLSDVPCLGSEAGENFHVVL
jgi:diguanylate cyclase (GGDEF)-like protein